MQCSITAVTCIRSAIRQSFYLLNLVRNVLRNTLRTLAQKRAPRQLLPHPMEFIGDSTGMRHAKNVGNKMGGHITDSYGM